MVPVVDAASPFEDESLEPSSVGVPSVVVPGSSVLVGVSVAVPVGVADSVGVGVASSPVSPEQPAVVTSSAVSANASSLVLECMVGVGTDAQRSYYYQQNSGGLTPE
jgi:hypothetical protein